VVDQAEDEENSARSFFLLSIHCSSGLAAPDNDRPLIFSDTRKEKAPPGAAGQSGGNVTCKVTPLPTGRCELGNTKASFPENRRVAVIRRKSLG
jgi:hypothetical protein